MRGLRISRCLCGSLMLVAVLLLARWPGGVWADDARPAAPLTVGVMGASVSAGFPTQIGLAKTLAAFLDVQTVDTASAQFFTDARAQGTAAVNRLRAARPTCVLGVDFLFWFVYGNRSATERLALLQEGFRLLEQFDCPVYVGDVPEMPASLILPASAVPPAAELAQFNRLIAVWAGKHPKIHVLPLAAWATALRTGQGLTLNGQPLKLPPADLFQMDGLHLTPKGLTYLTALVLEALAPTEPGLARQWRQRDPEAVLKSLLPPVPAAPAPVPAAAPAER